MFEGLGGGTWGGDGGGVGVNWVCVVKAVVACSMSDGSGGRGGC